MAKTKLVITRGLPGAGKTTRAKKWVDERPETRARVNRDDIRDMLHGGWLGSDVQEDQVTAVAHSSITVLLRAGFDVICDDTNLHDQHLRALCTLAFGAGADFEIWDMTHVPVDVCIARDAERGIKGGRYVGANVIQSMHDGYQRRRTSRRDGR